MLRRNIWNIMKNKIEILDNKKRQQFGDYAQHKYFGSWKN